MRRSMGVLRVSFGVGVMSLVCMAGTSNAQTAWQWRNPLPQGNRLNGVHVFDANTAVAVGTAGTVLRTTNAGASWATQHYAGGTTDNLRGVVFT
ncbi:MAG: hypothetical protein AAB393_06520, partial [Bacteroidota bacterium]